MALLAYIYTHIVSKQQTKYLLHTHIRHPCSHIDDVTEFLYTSLTKRTHFFFVIHNHKCHENNQLFGNTSPCFYYIGMNMKSKTHEKKNRTKKKKEEIGWHNESYFMKVIKDNFSLR